MQPTQPNERYHYLDVLRGFALIGVLIANMAYHSGFWFSSIEDQQALSGAYGDSVYWLIHVVTDGKFYSLFSLLFGIGFALQIERAIKRKQPFAARFSRRLLILFFIGLVHGIFFYVGDILMLYAMVGFALLLFRKASDRALLIWSIIFLVLPKIQYMFMWWQAQPVETISGGRPPFFDQIIQVYSSGSFAEIIKTNIGGIIFGRYPDILFTGRIFRVLAMFVLGYYVARKKYYLPSHKNRSLAKKVLVWGLIIGIPCNVILANMMKTEAYYAFGENGFIQPLVYAYGVPALGLAFAAALFLLFQKPAVKRVAMVLSPFGRMALTNYFSQSVIACAIYFSYGMGLYASHGPLQFTLVGFGILSSQILFSHLWLSKFQFGPLEWLWRSMTYKKWQPIKYSKKQL